MAAYSERGSFVHWLAHIKLSHLIGLLLVILITVPLIGHYYISNIGGDEESTDTYRSRSKLDHPEDLTNLKNTDMKFRIEELKKIKASVNNELRQLESKRQKLHTEISSYNTHIEQLKNEYEKSHLELDQLKVTIENTKLEHEDIKRKTMPDLQAPKRILPSLGDSVKITPPSSSSRCRMGSCFDYSRCSLTSQFPVYFYEPEEVSFSQSQLEEFIRLSVSYSFDASPYMTYDPHIACLYFVIVGDVKGGLRSAPDITNKLRGLQYWNGDGRNHVLLNLARFYSNHDVFEGVDIGRALIAQSSFIDDLYRPGYDIVIPPSLGMSYGEVWKQIHPVVPARRKYFLTFQGELNILKNMASSVTKENEGLNIKQVAQDSTNNIGTKILVNQAQLNQIPVKNFPSPDNERVYKENVVFNEGVDNLQNSDNKYPKRTLKSVTNSDTNLNINPVSVLESLLDLETTIIQTLKKMQVDFASDMFNFEFSCSGERVDGVNGEWSLCGPDSKRQDLLKDSTFVLIVAPVNSSVITTTLTQVRVYEALKSGAIPVILGDYIRLPFDEQLDWKHAAVVLPKQRISELHFYLRSIPDSDILHLRQRGRLFWSRYFGTTKSIIDTLLSVLRTRLNIPPYPTRKEASPSVFNSSFIPITEEVLDPLPESEDVLGPIEPPFASPTYLRNFSALEDVFNSPLDPFHLYPFTPFEPVMPGEAKFKGSGFGFRPIGKGAGGSGKEFNEALGGNIPREQFTVVMLTYEREAVLINALSRLKGLPHLNKVIVVWNSPRPPAEDLRWPEIGVKIVVIKTNKNSLNNRFLPYDAIETEAVLSIDDDAHLRHDEIIFGFRVWRESRDRIVGFPGRFHAYDLSHDQWMYNSNYSCELSMVLTGAAFFHKYYSYMYSYVMPQAIRDKVDEYLNCEDLAMNFLVAHITRKPPIKVTSRWTFRCPGCPQALSVDDEHFHERHKCMNYFAEVYGYMPLLYTQYRVDSVLFKTRIPHDKQKCFKFI